MSEITFQDARKLWADALRSGEYKQSTGQLCDGTGYCCLGVACEVYQKHVGGLERHVRSDGTVSYNGNRLSLPLDVQRWLNVTREGSLKDSVNDGYSLLSALNDDRKATFSELADIIEGDNLLSFDGGAP